MKILIIFIIMTLSNLVYSRDNSYFLNHTFIEPRIPMHTPAQSILSTIPIHHQVFLIQLYNSYMAEKESISLELLPAISDVISEKLFLERELLKESKHMYSSTADQIRIGSILKVIDEKNTMISNLLNVEASQHYDIQQELHKNIYMILKHWFSNNIMMNKQTADIIIQELSNLYHATKE